MLELNLLTAVIEIWRFGKMDGENRNIDLIFFSHPLYYERIEGYENAKVCFEINNN